MQLSLGHFQNSIIVTLCDNMMDCLEDFRYFCCSRSLEGLRVLHHILCTHVWQKPNDSKTENKALTVGIKLFEILDRNNVSAKYQILKIGLLVSNFGWRF